MKKRFRPLRPLPFMLGAILLTAGIAAAQANMPHNPRDPQAYETGGWLKSTANLPNLRSTVHYVTRTDTLSPYDSSWISYDAAGQRVTELLTFRWDGLKWMPFDRYTYSFNGSGVNDKTLYDLWNVTAKVYVPLVRYNYLHNGAGERIQLHYEIWSVANTSWTNGLLEFYNLDAAGLRTSIMQQTWTAQTTSWMNNTLEDMTYNSKGRQDSYVISSWENNTTNWVKKRQTLTSFDASGTLATVDQDFVWNNLINGWIYKARTLYSLSNGKTATKTQENYDAVNTRWIPLNRESMTYNAQGSLGTSVMADWNPAVSSYVDQLRSAYTYNKDYQLKRVLSLVPDQGKWIVATGAAETKYYYDGEKAESLRVQSNSGPSLTIAPVPATTVLDIRIGGAPDGSYGLQVLDLSGRRVMGRQVELRSGVAAGLDISQLPAGNYSLMLGGEKLPPVSRMFSIVR